MTSSYDAINISHSHDVYSKVIHICKLSLLNYLPFKSFEKFVLGKVCTPPKNAQGLIVKAINFDYASNLDSSIINVEELISTTIFINYWESPTKGQIFKKIIQL